MNWGRIEVGVEELKTAVLNKWMDIGNAGSQHNKYHGA